jgi:ketosteroid isomerase-like protein
MVMPSVSRVAADEAAVLAVNSDFYRALESLDPVRMEAVWWHEEWVRCLHPGWDLMVGWAAVRESWTSIFHSTTQLKVTKSRPLVQVVGDVAWISCLEEMTATVETDFATIRVEATNLFVRRNGEWRLAHRHTTPMPGRVTSDAPQSVQ